MVSRNLNALPFAQQNIQEIQSPSFEPVVADDGSSASLMVAHNSKTLPFAQQHSQEIQSPSSSPMCEQPTVQQVGGTSPSVSNNYDENREDDNDQNESESVQESSGEKMEHLEITIVGTQEEINLMEVVGTFIGSQKEKQSQITEERDYFHRCSINSAEKCKQLEDIIRESLDLNEKLKAELKEKDTVNQAFITKEKIHGGEIRDALEKIEKLKAELKEKDTAIQAFIRKENIHGGEIREAREQNQKLQAKLEENGSSLQQMLVKQDADKIELLRIKELVYTMETKLNNKQQSFDTLVKDMKTSKEEIISSVQKIFEHIEAR